MKLFNFDIYFRSPISIKIEWRFKEWCLTYLRPTFFKVRVCGEWVLCYSLWSKCDKKALKNYEKINFIVLNPTENNVTGGGTFINNIKLINPVFNVSIKKITNSSRKTIEVSNE